MNAAKHFLIGILSLVFMGAGFAQKELPHVPGNILIQLKPGTKPADVVASYRNYGNGGLKLSQGKLVSKPMRIWLFEFSPDLADDKALLASLRAHPAVAVVQFNHYITMRNTIPNDPQFSSQWQWLNTGASGGTADADVDADLAWDITTGGLTSDGDTIVACVVDDGTDLDHPDLAPNLWINYGEIPNDNIDNDNNGYEDDYYGWNINSDNDNVGNGGHGVNVDGMIGGVGNNGTGGTGINWNVKIMTVRYGSTQEDQVIEAYTYPLVMRQLYNQTNGEQGAFVVVTNSSWGIDFGQPSDAPLWCAFYDTLGAAGILSCAATANNPVDVDAVGDLPTACPSDFMLSVTATDKNDERTFSAYGVTQIDVGAPGDNIYTTAAGGGYTTTSGTSFASPLTAGIVALLYSAPCSNLISLAKDDPAAAALLVKQFILQGVDVVPGLQGDILSGGRVNAYNSLLLLLENCGPCPSPHAIEIGGITDQTATVSWINPDSAVTADLYVHLTGDVVWDTVQNVVSPYVLTGLVGCNSYEIVIEASCDDTLSGISSVVTFETEGCCVFPDGLAIADIEEANITVSWNSIFAANSYDLQLTDSGTGNTQVINVPAPASEFLLTGLLSCTPYEVRIRTNCDTGYTAWSPAVPFVTKGCGACLDAGYCEALGESQEFEFIENVTLGSIDNTTGADGYGDYTNLSTDLIRGLAYDISLTPGFTGNDYAEYFRVWIDFNQDGDFTDAGELAFDAGETNSTIEGSVTAPLSATVGSTRMRVSMKYTGGFDPAPASCETIGEGEVEDYCVNILDQTISCASAENLDTLIVTANAVTFFWSAAPAALHYNVRYKKPVSSFWNYLYGVTPPVSVSSLEDCEQYEYQVQTVCTNDSTGYSTGFEFTTDCINATVNPAVSEKDLSVYPNPFTDDLMIHFYNNGYKNIHIQISDPAGKELYAQDYNFAQYGWNDLTIRNLKHLSSGIYILKMTTDGVMTVRRVVKDM